jgi:hypothetical protein
MAKKAAPAMTTYLRVLFQVVLTGAGTLERRGAERRDRHGRQRHAHDDQKSSSHARVFLETPGLSCVAAR